MILLVLTFFDGNISSIDYYICFLIFMSLKLPDHLAPGSYADYGPSPFFADSKLTVLAAQSCSL